jgi:hypothetical protein
MYRFSTSANQAAYRSSAPLSNDQIARYAPSVLATEAHSSRGDSPGAAGCQVGIESKTKNMKPTETTR